MNLVHNSVNPVITDKLNQKLLELLVNIVGSIYKNLENF